MSQTHICFFTDHPAPGEIGTHMALLLARMDARRYACHLVCPPTAGALIARAEIAGAIYHPFIGSKGDAPGAYTRLVRLLRELPVQLFHAHMDAGLAGAWGIRAADEAGVPVILATEHLPYRLPPGAATVEKAAVNRLLDRVIIVSDEARYSHIASGTVTPAQAVAIPQGIDPLPFLHPDPASNVALRGALGLSAAGPLIGVFGEMVAQKGQRYLLDAWPAVRVAAPGAMLLLIGDGPLRPALERQARTLGVADSVVFLGAHADVPALLHLCSVVVVPSVFEGFPLTVLEAMAAARPVVGTRVCGVSEAIVEGETGRLVPPEDPDALGVALVRLLRAPAQARRMGQAGRLRVVREYHIRQMIERACAVYESLLDAKARPCHVPDMPGAQSYVVL